MPEPATLNRNYRQRQSHDGCAVVNVPCLQSAGLSAVSGRGGWLLWQGGVVLWRAVPPAPQGLTGRRGASYKTGLFAEEKQHFAKVEQSGAVCCGTAEPRRINPLNAARRRRAPSA